MIEVFIPTNKGVRAIMSDSIVRIEGNSNYCRIYFNNAYPLTVAKVLHWFEEHLQDDFYRIHKTHIVNRQFISGISSDNNILTLHNGEQLKISRRRKSSFLKMMA